MIARRPEAILKKNGPANGGAIFFARDWSNSTPDLQPSPRRFVYCVIPDQHSF